MSLSVNGCERCGRVECPTLLPPLPRGGNEALAIERNLAIEARADDCDAHRVDWRALYFAALPSSPVVASVTFKGEVVEVLDGDDDDGEGNSEMRISYGDWHDEFLAPALDGVKYGDEVTVTVSRPDGGAK